MVVPGNHGNKIKNPPFTECGLRNESFLRDYVENREKGESTPIAYTKRGVSRLFMLNITLSRGWEADGE